MASSLFGFLLAVKTSEIFDVVVLFGCVLLKCRETGSWKKLLRVTMLSFFPILLWRAPIRAVFPYGMVTKHAFSLEYLFCQDAFGQELERDEAAYN